MSVHFVTYATIKFRRSLKRILLEAKKINLFDSIKAYGPKDLPPSITSSPLMLFERGAGYWIWKPYVIWNALKESKDGDIVVYIDSGSSIQKSSSWDYYLGLMKEHNAILFQYDEKKDYKWSTIKDFYKDSTKLESWLKKSVVDYFSHLYKGDPSWYLEKDILWAGFLIIKKTPELSLIEEWLKVLLFEPQLCMDLFEIEKDYQSPNYSEHRYDQSILSALAYYYKENEKIIFLKENSEHPFTSNDRPAVLKGNISIGNYYRPSYKKLFDKLKRVLK